MKRKKEMQKGINKRIKPGMKPEQTDYSDSQIRWSLLNRKTTARLRVCVWTCFRGLKHSKGDKGFGECMEAHGEEKG